MKSTEIIESLENLMAVQRPAFIWGGPGVGKSSVVHQIAKKKKLELIDIRAILLDPVDLRGLPRASKSGETEWLTPAFLPKSGKGILFLDELNVAPPMVQAACYQLVLDRKLGDYELPSGWYVCAAGNRETDGAAAQ